MLIIPRKHERGDVDFWQYCLEGICRQALGGGCYDLSESWSTSSANQLANTSDDAVPHRRAHAAGEQKIKERDSLLILEFDRPNGSAAPLYQAWFNCQTTPWGH